VEDFVAPLVGQQENELLEALTREQFEELLEHILRREDAKNSGAAA